MLVSGKNIILRTADISDAQFIFEMRMLENKNKYLSVVKGTVDDQVNWLRAYKIRENEGREFYFIIENKMNEKLGLIRIYDFKKDSFCWGSWIIKDGAPSTTAIESALQIYQIGFEKLKFKFSHFDVRKNNKRVVAFHQRFGAEIVGEDDLNYYFRLSKSTYEKIKLKYARFI